MQTIKAVVSSILSPSSTANEQQGSSDPHNGNTPAQQVKEDQQLSEATRDLSLEDKSTQGASAGATGLSGHEQGHSTNALGDRKQQEGQQTGGLSSATGAGFSSSTGKESAEIPSVQEEVQAVTSQADRQAIETHDRLLADIEQQVPEVQPVSEGGAGADSSASIMALAPAEALARGQAEQDVPRVAKEVHDAAPEADPRAIQTHSLLVSEIEAVVGGEEGQPVHKIVKAVERPETPAELNAPGHDSQNRIPGSTPSVEHTGNPFESQSAGEPSAEPKVVYADRDTLVVNAGHGEVSSESLDKSMLEHGLASSVARAKAQLH